MPSAMRFRLAPTACLTALACATAKPVPLPPDPATLPPLPHSSLAAVLSHREELNLTDEEVRLLQRLDDHLQEEDAAILAEAAKEPPPEKRKPQEDETIDVHTDDSAGGVAGGMGGMGGMGSHGGRHSYPEKKKKVEPVPSDKDRKSTRLNS